MEMEEVRAPHLKAGSTLAKDATALQGFSKTDILMSKPN